MRLCASLCVPLCASLCLRACVSVCESVCAFVCEFMCAFVEYILMDLSVFDSACVVLICARRMALPRSVIVDVVAQDTYTWWRLHSLQADIAIAARMAPSTSGIL